MGKRRERAMADKLGLIELLGFGAVALGWGFWQLWSLRDRPKDDE